MSDESSDADASADGTPESGVAGSADGDTPGDETDASGDESDDSADGESAAGGDSEPTAGESDPDDERVPVEDVTHVAELARVDIDDREATEFASQFADILSYFEALDEVPEVDDEASLTNVMRADEEREGLTQSEALANAAETEQGYFKGPRVS